MSSGQDFSLILLKVNTVVINEFLKQMSQYLGEKEAIIVMDGAGWHKSKDLEVPQNIEIVYLPPYSPELNPVEKLWQYVKFHTIKNKIYETIGDLEAAICNFVQGLKPDLIKLTCSSNHYTC